MSQPREGTRASVNLTDEGRGEAAERRAKAHLGREDPIACPHLAGERSVRLYFGRIQCKRDRSEQIKRVRLKCGECWRVAPSQHGL